MSKYRITKSGKKAQELRKKLNKNERVSLEDALKIVGKDVYKSGDELMWVSAINKKNKKVTLKRDPISENVKRVKRK